MADEITLANRQFEVRKAGKGGGSYYLVYSCSHCNEKIGSKDAMQQHIVTCNAAPDTSWIKKESEQEASTVEALEKLYSSETYTNVIEGQKQVASNSCGSTSHSGITVDAKTEHFATAPAKDYSLAGPLCTEMSTQTVEVMAEKTLNLSAANTSQPLQVPSVRSPAPLTISPKYHEPTKNMTASEVLMKKCFPFRKKKAASSNTVAIRSILPKTPLDNDLSVPRIQTVYYTSKANACDQGEIKVADNALQMPSVTAESLHSKQQHTMAYSHLGAASKSKALSNLVSTHVQKKSEPGVKASVAESQQTIPQTMKPSQGDQNVPQCVQQIPTAVLHAPLGLAQAPQGLLTSTQSLFQNQQGLLQNNQNLIQQFIPQNVILLQPNQVILKNQAASQFLQLVAPQTVNVQPPLSGINMLNTGSSSVLNTGSSSLHLPASTTVMTSTSTMSHVQSSKGNESSSVTSAVNPVATGAKPFVPASMPATLPRLIGGVNLTHSSQPVQTIPANATRFIWVPRSSFSSAGCSDATQFQSPASTSSLLITGTGLLERVGGVTVDSVPQKPDQEANNTGVGISSQMVSASVSGLNISVVKQIDGSTVVLLPPVISEGYRLNGIRMEDHMKLQSTTSATVVNRLGQTGPRTTKSGTTSKDSSAKATLPVSESANHNTGVSLGQKRLRAKNKNVVPPNPANVPAVKMMPANKYRTLVPKSKLVITESGSLYISGTGKDQEAKSSVTIQVDNSVHHQTDDTAAAEVVIFSEFKVTHIAALLLSGCIKNKPSPVILDDGRPFLPLTYTGPYVPRGIQGERRVSVADDPVVAAAVLEKEDVVSDMVERSDGASSKDTILFIKKEDDVDRTDSVETVNTFVLGVKENSDLVERSEGTVNTSVGIKENSDVITRFEETRNTSVVGMKENASMQKMIQTIEVPGKVVWLFLDFDGPKLLWKFGEDGKVFAVPLDQDLPCEVLDEIHEILHKYKLTFPSSINPISAGYIRKKTAGTMNNISSPCGQKLPSVSLEPEVSLESRSVSHVCKHVNSKLGAKTAEHSHGHVTGSDTNLQKESQQLIVRESAIVVQRALEAFVQLQRLPLTDVLQQQLKAYMETHTQKRLQLEGFDKQTMPAEIGYLKTVDKRGVKYSCCSETQQEVANPDVRSLRSVITKEVDKEYDQLQNMSTDLEKKKNPGQIEQSLKSDNIEMTACERGTSVTELVQKKKRPGRQSSQEQKDAKERSRKRGLISNEPAKHPVDGFSPVSSDTGVRKSFRLVCKPKTNYMHLLQEGFDLMDDDSEQIHEAEEEYTPAKVRRRMKFRSMPQPKLTMGRIKGLQSSKIVSGFDIYIDKADSTEKEDGTRHSAVGRNEIVKTKMDETMTQVVDPFLKMHSADFREVVLKKSQDPELGIKGNVFYVCMICGSFQCRLEDELVKHMKQHYSGELTCKICSFHVACKQELLEHEALEHTGKHLYSCNVCQTNFFTQAVFQNHKKRHDSKTACKACKLDFANEILFRAHMEKNHGARKFMCKLCMQHFRNEDKVRAHYKVCIDGYQCCLCFIKEKDVSVLRTHMAKDHGHHDELHICNFEHCGACFLMPEELGSHTNVHLSALRQGNKYSRNRAVLD